jgi:hypothetical protein
MMNPAIVETLVNNPSNNENYWESFLVVAMVCFHHDQIALGGPLVRPPPPTA